jgi:hypothetical protein
MDTVPGERGKIIRAIDLLVTGISKRAQNGHTTPRLFEFAM